MATNTSIVLQVFDGTLDGACPDDFMKRLSGASVTKASRKGKQLWLEFGSRPSILFHLGMTGSFAAIHPDGTQESAEYVNTKVDMKLWPPKHWKLHFEMKGGGKIAFIAVRRFERIRMVQNPEKEVVLPTHSLQYIACHAKTSDSTLWCIASRPFHFWDSTLSTKCLPSRQVDAS